MVASHNAAELDWASRGVILDRSPLACSRRPRARAKGNLAQKPQETSRPVLSHDQAPENSNLRDGNPSHDLPRRRRPLAAFSQNDETPGFYLSLSDLMALLLVFFVLIFSLTHNTTVPQEGPVATRKIVKPMPPAPPPRRLPPITPHLQPATAVQTKALKAMTSSGQDDPGLMREERRLEHVSADLGQSLPALAATGPTTTKARRVGGEARRSQLLAQVRSEVQAASSGLELDRGPDKLVLRLPENITFDLGKAEIKPGMKTTLHRLAQVLKRHIGCTILVSGHTDDLPISNRFFASNWDLSAARAAAVARALSEKGAAESKITIQGLADKKPRAPNTSRANRQQNRRVEIELRLKG